VLGHEVHRVRQSRGQSEDDRDGHVAVFDRALPEPIDGFWVLETLRSSPSHHGVRRNRAEPC
jgi:hypothetical protein